jgi:hypothetical protein
MSEVVPPLPSVEPSPKQPELRFRHERVAKWLCIGTGLGLLFLMLPVIVAVPQLASAFYAALGAGIVAAFWFTVRSARAKGNAVLISEQQWPELHRIVLECQGRLGLKGIRAYVVQDLVLEQAGMRLGDDRSILLRSSLVDAALTKGDLDTLRFLIGRKCGQVAFGHHRFTSTTLAQVGRLVYPLYAWYRRCQERSADRAGLWAATSRQQAHHGLAVMAAGVQIGNRLSPQAVKLQLDGSRPGFWVRLIGWHTERTFYPLRLNALQGDADELGVRG